MRRGVGSHNNEASSVLVWLTEHPMCHSNQSLLAKLLSSSPKLQSATDTTMNQIKTKPICHLLFSSITLYSSSSLLLHSAYRSDIIDNKNQLSVNLIACSSIADGFIEILRGGEGQVTDTTSKSETET